MYKANFYIYKDFIKVSLFRYEMNKYEFDPGSE